MTVLISGGLGFIGSRLVEKLMLEDDVHIFDRRRIVRDNYHRGDINDYHSLERAFEIAKPDLVIHLAGMVSRKECEETPSLAITTNAVGTHNVCVLSLKHHARLIYSGSSEEYGTAFTNRFVTEDTPFGEPTSIYSMTKRMAEEIVQYNAFFKGLQATTVRIFMLYGPNEKPNEYRSAIIRFTYSALKNEPLTAHKGTERSWCYIDDAVEALKLLIERQQKPQYEVFNIGRDDPINTELLAETIVKLCESSSPIKRIDPPPTIIPIKRASFKKAKEVLGWEAKTPLSQGLKQVVNWMKSNYNKKREDEA